MSEKLSFEEWKERYGPPSVTPEIMSTLKHLGGDRAVRLIQRALLREYRSYINGCYEKENDPL